MFSYAFFYSHLQEFADKIHVTRKIEILLRKLEITLGKEENAGYKLRFLPFPMLFTKGFLCTVIKSRDCVVKG